MSRAIPFKAGDDPRDFDTTIYHSEDEINAWFASLAKAYPSMVNVTSVGTSHEGRPIQLIKVSKLQEPCLHSIIDELPHRSLCSSTIAFVLHFCIVLFSRSASRLASRKRYTGSMRESTLASGSPRPPLFGSSTRYNRHRLKFAFCKIILKIF